MLPGGRHPPSAVKDGWLDEPTAWQKRDLSAKRNVYTVSLRREPSGAERDAVG